jgi:hypothetical protein
MAGFCSRGFGCVVLNFSMNAAEVKNRQAEACPTGGILPTPSRSLGVEDTIHLRQSASIRIFPIHIKPI